MLGVRCDSVVSGSGHTRDTHARQHPRMQRRLLAGLAAALLTTLALAEPAGFYTTPFEKKPSVAVLTTLGRALFMDASLSASGKTSCASCHDPAHAYGPPNDRAVQLAGPNMQLAGVRAVPSLRYQQNVPAFTEHFFDSDGNDSEDQGPAGGHNWDGRAASVHEQAAIPLLSPFEMANANERDVVRRVARGSNAAAFRNAFGDKVFDDPALAFKGVVMALEVFQQSPADFYPYDSKFDAFLRGKAKLSTQEERGMALFNNPAKGNCMACHPSAVKGGALPAFTDFGFIALGVPRNAAIPANRNASYRDMGLCGPTRTDLADHTDYCGRFRTPSLRNTATRKVFFHNGAMHTLEQVMQFYAQRDSQPAKWYPRKGGQPDKFNDLPKALRENVNTDAPFGAAAGGKDALNAEEIRDLIAFLNTLTDGYRP